MASKLKSKGSKSNSLSSDVSTPAGGKRSTVRAPTVLAKEEERPSLAYKVLPAVKTKRLMEADDVLELEKLVAEALSFKDTKYDLKAGALLDFYVGALWWCREQSFNADQTSALFTVIDTLINNLISKQVSLVGNVQCLKKMLMGIGCPDILDGEADDNGGLQTLFDTAQAKQIISYIQRDLFQHYRLYEIMFTSHQSEHVIGTSLRVETAPPADTPWPPPLTEAIPIEVFNERFQPVQPDAQVVEDATVVESDACLAEDSLSQAEERLKYEAEILSKLSADQVQRVVQEVCAEMLSGLETDVAARIQKKENDFIAQINLLVTGR